MKDTSAPDLTVKVTGYQWKWGYDYLQDGFGFYSNLSTPLAQIENREPKGDELPARGRQSAGRAGRRQGARADHRRRRAPRVVGAGVRRQAGRDPRLRARHVVQGREGRHLSRPVRRALRQGARLHADRRRGQVEGRLREVGRRAEAEARRGGRRSEQGVDRGGARWRAAQKVYAANCAACHQANGKGVPARSRRSTARKVVHGPEGRADPHRAERQAGKPTAMAPWKQLSDTDIAAVITYTRNSWGNKAGDAIQPAESSRRANEVGAPDTQRSQRTNRPPPEHAR